MIAVLPLFLKTTLTLIDTLLPVIHRKQDFMHVQVIGKRKTGDKSAIL